MFYHSNVQVNSLLGRPRHKLPNAAALFSCWILVTVAANGCEADDVPKWILAAESLEIPGSADDSSSEYHSKYYKPSMVRAAKHLRSLNANSAKIPYPIVARVLSDDAQGDPNLLLLWFQLGTEDCEITLYDAKTSKPIGSTKVGADVIKRVQEATTDFASAALRLTTKSSDLTESDKEQGILATMKIDKALPSECEISLRSKAGESPRIALYTKKE